MKEISPSFDDVAAFVREFADIRGSCSITPSTRLEEDLGITGSDGDDLLQKAANRFGAELAASEGGYRTTFGLGPNEYLFASEGVDLLGVSAVLRWLGREPKPVILDLTVGQFHEALLRTRTPHHAI